MKTSLPFYINTNFLQRTMNSAQIFSLSNELLPFQIRTSFNVITTIDEFRLVKVNMQTKSLVAETNLDSYKSSIEVILKDGYTYLILEGLNFNVPYIDYIMRVKYNSLNCYSELIKRSNYTYGLIP